MNRASSATPVSLIRFSGFDLHPAMLRGSAASALTLGLLLTPKIINVGPGNRLRRVVDFHHISHQFARVVGKWNVTVEEDNFFSTFIALGFHAGGTCAFQLDKIQLHRDKKFAVIPEDGGE
ncbi:hypothetical protein [Roseimicrobium sp. ORNL1]|uniref:hypothetical protein n=1 Tax=Roseimicrobium sp. ORNL1 TaxID=2711231 RepID=UPI0013E1BC17|nr:hypothetical protein [Roseimicrobium sp. ORNL1]QIF02875.1 hypothetical protein G5S37_15555 [Roseimicrobium sp. ORNL1]